MSSAPGFREVPFGQAIQLEATFINATTGAAANPTTTTFQVALVVANPPPDPTPTTAVFGVDAAVQNPATGRFTYDFTPALPGNYIARVFGTGAVVAATPPFLFRVLPTLLA